MWHALLIAAYFLLGSVQAEELPLQAKKGILDLRNWDFEKQGIVELKGEWQLFWKQVISPDEIASATEFHYFPMPMLWNGKNLDDILLSGDSFATYRLQVKMPAGERILRLLIKDLPTAYRLWMNDNEIIRFGVVGKDEASSIAAVGPRDVTLIHKGEDLDIVLQVSSFFHIAGGTWHPVKIGLAEDFERKTMLEISLDMMVLSCVIIMALYHFVIYWLRGENAGPLALAIFCSFIAVRVAIAGDGQLAIRFFQPNFVLYRRLELISFYAAVPSFLVFAHLIYPRFLSKNLTKASVLVCVPFLLAVALMPPRVFTETILYYQILAIILVLISLSTFVRAFIQRQDGSLIFVLGGMIMTAATINDILVARQFIHGANVIGFGLYGFIFFQSVAIAKIFARAFREVKANEKTIQNLNQKLQEHIENLDHIVEEKTREVRSIMTYIRQGICMVSGEELRIVGEYSSYFEEMTGYQNLGGRKFLNLIFAVSDLTKSQCEQIEQTLVNSLNQQAFTFDVNKHLLAKEFSRKNNNGKIEIFELDWNIIEDEKAVIARYLITIRNVTQLRSLQEEAIRNQEEWIVIQDLLQTPTQKLPEILLNMSGMLEEVFEILTDNPDLKFSQQNAANQEENSVQSEQQILIFRLLHTMKGNAHSFGMSSLASLLHEVENDWSPKLQQSSVGFESNGSLSRWDGLLKVKNKIHQYQLVMEEKLYIGKNSTESGIFIPWSVLRSLVYKLKNILNWSSNRNSSEKILNDLSSQDLPVLLQNIVDLSFQPIEQIVSEIIQSLRIKISSLEKELPLIKVQDHGILFDPVEHQFLLSILTHLIRNSIGHGLESRNQRVQKRKPLHGCIKIHVQYDNKTHLVTMTYEDDGQGYNIATLKKKGIQNGLIDGSETNQQEILDLIFQPDLSTQDKATDLAGRGIGLDAVRYLLRKRGGDIRIRPIHELGGGFCHCQLELVFQAEVWFPQ
ncbi:MAG: 7TM diverse intracellular signaling domain-containing protein [Oligoflexus sp.]